MIRADADLRAADLQALSASAGEERLTQFLAALPSGAARKVGRVIEIARATGEQGLPHQSILDALRPVLREARPERVPTLQRRVCEGFEAFLTNDANPPRRKGVIPRAVIMPWWAALERLEPQRLGALTEAYGRTLTARDHAEAKVRGDDIAIAARAFAHEATERMLRRSLESQPYARELVQILGGPQRLEQVREIAHVLSFAEPIRSALNVIVATALRELEWTGPPPLKLPDLPGRAVSMAKSIYMDLSDDLGEGMEYLTLSLIGRLDRPWHALRLARALSPRPDEAMSGNAQVAVIRERLALLIDDQIAVLIGLMRRPGSDLPPEQRFGRALRATETFMVMMEGVTEEIQVRRGSEWGRLILELRQGMSDAVRPLVGPAMDAAAAPLPDRARALKDMWPDLNLPLDPPEVAGALSAAEFLRVLAQRGERHGLAGTASTAITELEHEIDRRSRHWLTLLRERQSDPLIATRLEVIVEVLRQLGEIRSAAQMDELVKQARRHAGVDADPMAGELIVAARALRR